MRALGFRSRLLAVPATAVCVLGGALLHSAGASGEAADPPPFRDGHKAVPAVQNAQSASFSILRRARTADDVMPANAARLLGDPRETGKNPGLARGFDSPTGRGWVLPGDGVVCAAVPDPVDGFGMSCSAADAAATGGVIGALSTPAAGVYDVFVVVPDGGSVIAITRGGGTRPLPAKDGVVAQRVGGASAIVVTTATGTGRLELPATLPGPAAAASPPPVP